MAKLCVGAVVLAGAAVCTAGEADRISVKGGCDDLASVVFLLRGHTQSGAPYYKATDAELYMYWDPDCAGSTDGTPRWIIDDDEPGLDLANDLDYDGSCGYRARVDSNDKTVPPSQGLWSMTCDGEPQLKRLSMDTGASSTTTTTSGTRTRTTTALAAAVTTRAGQAPEVLQLQGACQEKAFLNGLAFEQAGATADGRSFYKARGEESYLYYDADCDGDGAMYSSRWVLDDSQPSTVALEDLDQDRQCQYHARFASSSFAPPTSGTWKMYCGSEGWVDRQITFTKVKQVVSGAARAPLAPLLGAAAAALAWARAPR